MEQPMEAAGDQHTTASSSSFLFGEHFLNNNSLEQILIAVHNTI